MDFQTMLQEIEEDRHLIGMIPARSFLRFGYEIGLNAGSRVLDLCCGYGTVLKLWAQAFGISGVGVDWSEGFLQVGRERLQQAGVSRVELRLGDVMHYEDEAKYDVVILSETMDDIPATFALGERFLKAGGTLVFQKLYAKVPKPPQALMDFDLEVLPLTELNRIFNDLGYDIVAMASDSPDKWEQYTFGFSAARDREKLLQDPANAARRQALDAWTQMYLQYRRPFEGQALFGLKRR